MFSFPRLLAIVWRQYYLLRGSPARILPLFAWVTIDILLWGFISRYFGVLSGSTPSMIATLLGAVLLWDFFQRVMHGLAAAFLEDVWSRNFLNFFASPLSLPEYLGGLVVTSIATSSLGLIAMLVLATTAFGLSYAVYGLLLLPFLLVLFLFGIALGIFSTAIVLRLGPASEWLVWPIPALVSPFAGVFYPLSTLPVWMRFISYLLPPSYVFEGMRTVVAGGVFSVTSLAGGLALALLYILLACWCFSRVYRHAVQTGLLARYSAESVS